MKLKVSFVSSGFFMDILVMIIALNISTLLCVLYNYNRLKEALINYDLT